MNLMCFDIFNSPFLEFVLEYIYSHPGFVSPFGCGTPILLVEQPKALSHKGYIVILLIPF